MAKRYSRLWWWSPRNRSSFWKNDGDPAAAENFGDLLGPFLLEHLTEKNALFTPIDHPLRPRINVSVGSILSVIKENCVVWGSGIINRDQYFNRADFRAVRGPLSHLRCRELGYSCPDIFGDPAILLPNIVPPCETTNYDIGIIPHYSEYSIIKDRFSNITGVNIIDVTQPVECVIREITSCARNLSSSLHGIIVSHAYGVPCTWIKLSNNLFGDGIKFQDYFSSVGLDNQTPLFLGDDVNQNDLFEISKRHHISLLPRLNLDDMKNKLISACPF